MILAQLNNYLHVIQSDYGETGKKEIYNASSVCFKSHFNILLKFLHFSPQTLTFLQTPISFPHPCFIQPMTGVDVPTKSCGWWFENRVEVEAWRWLERNHHYLTQWNLDLESGQRMNNWVFQCVQDRTEELVVTV